MTSIRQTTCPECGSHSVESAPLEENHHKLNVRAGITCKACGHKWEGHICNPARKGTWGGLPLGIRRKPR